MKISEAFAKALPLKFHLDNVNGTGFFENDLADVEEQVRYFQKFATTDEIRVQLWARITDDSGADPTFTATLVNEYGTTILTATVYSALTGVEDESLLFYRFLFSLSSITTYGVHYVVVTVTDADGTRTYVSEPIDIQTSHENTVLLTYNNRRIGFDVNWLATNATFYFRVEGGFWEENFTPATKDVIYFNQSHDPVLLSSVPFCVQKLTIGDAFGVPNWIADKVNRIFACSTVLVDGVGYCKNEGAKMEPAREKQYPMAAWTLELVEATNEYSY